MASVTEWISAISQLVFTMVFILLILGFNQRFQMFISSRSIAAKLKILESYAIESKQKALEFMRKEGSKDPEAVVSTVSEYFMIEPVDIEPVDIIKRLENLFRTQERRLEKLVESVMPSSNEVARSVALTALEIAAALNQVYKLVRHYLLLGRKTNNWLLIMQLDMLLPTLIRQAKSYRDALDTFLEVRPIGDGAGPLVAFNLVFPREPLGEITKDTVYYETEMEGRKVYVVKAKGPKSNVGHPGEAVERLIEKLREEGKGVGLVITVDAALKLEGEETGSVAEGVGAAIGDPGPEKIRIERVAARYGIPLYAIVVKMSLEEAITDMRKDVSDAVDKVIERIRELVKTVPEESVVVVAGIGNTVGIA